METDPSRLAMVRATHIAQLFLSGLLEPFDAVIVEVR